MATLGQYQSFAIISYDALLQQTIHVSNIRKAGANIDGAYTTLNTAKHMINSLLRYSIDCDLPPGFDENSAIGICDWLMKNLMFNIGGAIESLEETYINSLTDFSWEDFNPYDLN
jgi:hypothetical protein